MYNIAEGTIERAARAIAANKRGVEPYDKVIDAVWPSYMGQARAALELSSLPQLLEMALPYVDAHAAGSHLMDGFGEHRAARSDVVASLFRFHLGLAERILKEGEVLKRATTAEDFAAISRDDA